MAKVKLIPDADKATVMTPSEFEAYEAKQQMNFDVEEPLTGRKAKVNMTLHTGRNLLKGKIPQLIDEDIAELRKSYPGPKIKKILE